mmetsp:Transcript_90650/g.253257  ORF Transcript_90650/g.253257 Transcript_90650/m.253257 type:complete len:206 (-) Transcript_90650:389-1006(-)
MVLDRRRCESPRVDVLLGPGLGGHHPADLLAVGFRRGAPPEHESEPRVLQGHDGAGAFARVLRQQLARQSDAWAAGDVPEGVQCAVIAPHSSPQCRHVVLATEGQPPPKEEVEDDAGAEDVGRLLAPGLQHDLRSDETWRPAAPPELLLIREGAAHAVVCKHRRAVAPQEDVRGLDVPVDEASTVDVVQRLEQARHDVASLLLVH